LPFVARVKSDRVSVRAGQNANFETVAVVNKDTTLVVLAKSYGWFKVKVPPQSKVYLKAEYAALLTPPIGEITADKVNIRCAANTNATIIGRLERGDRFSVISREGDWLLIKPHDKLSGWVKEEFLEPVKGAAVPARLYPDPQIVAPTASTVPTPSAEVPSK
jgi:N-acetylmuramoyl-L-alanine amidase